MIAPTPPEGDPLQPWPGLAPYGPQDASNFHGREDEIRILSQMVAESIQVTIFGPSGTGKTSLLRAGVLPALAERDFVPVYVRLDHSRSAPAHGAQIRQAIEEQFRRLSIEVDPLAEPTRRDEEESLWEYLHRNEFWSARNRLVRPVIVIDQFEEIFTLGQTAQKTRELIEQLGDLCSNSVPRTVESYLAANGKRLGYPIDTQNYRLVLSLREDFLARLEEATANVPSLRRNRLGITPMNGMQALRAVLGPGKDLLDETVARQIVATVGSSQEESNTASTDEELRALSVEPALLSLFCRELNERRIKDGAARITAEQVARSGSDILKSFYAAAMAAVSPKTQAFAEDRLLTTSGYRTAVAMDDVAALGIEPREIQELVDRRILRIDERRGVSWVEFTHDLLTGVASDSRRKRLQQQREAEIRRHALKRLRVAVVAAFAVGVILAAVLGSWWWDYHRHRQEIVKYYNTWTKRFGLPVGIGELSADQVRHRSVSFKLIRYGSANPVTRMIAVDGHGNLTGRHGVGTYLHELDDSGAPARECQWEFMLDSTGQRPVYEKALDRSGNLVWGFIYSPVRAGNIVRASAVGRDGFPQARAAENGSAAEYVEIEYGSDGLEQRITYRDRRGNPMPSRDRAYGQLRKYNEAGLPIYIASLGPPDAHGTWPKIIDDKGNCAQKAEYDAMGNATFWQCLDEFDRPITTKNGYCAIRSDLDGWGREVHRQYLDPQGKPCFAKNGYAGWRYEYDDNGNIIKSTRLDPNGNPVASQRRVAISRMKYDSEGNAIEWSGFDTQDQPAIDETAGNHSVVRTFNDQGKVVEERYFGLDGKPGLQDDPYAIYRAKYDAAGDLVESSYFDLAGRPACQAIRGYHALREVYNDQGEVIERRWLNCDGNPFTLSDGYAISRAKYDDRGNELEQSWFDAAEHAAVDLSTGVHLIRTTYNDHGQAVESRCYDCDNQLCLHKDGFAIQRMEYDFQGNRTGVAAFDIQDRPILIHSIGTHAIRRTYDNRGNEIEDEWFGVDDKPCLQRNGYARVKLKFDDRNNQTEMAYFDVDGRPALDSETQSHMARFAYDDHDRIVEKRWFGVDGKPCIQAAGYSIVRISYDAFGNQTDWKFFDTSDRPTLDTATRAHELRQSFNERNKLTEKQWLGVSDEPALQTSGYSTIRIKYNSIGKQAEWACFGPGDRPAIDRSDGTHMSRSAYDEFGNLIEIKYFGPDQKASVTKDGVAIIRRKYDARGNQIEQAVFDAANHPVAEKSTGLHMRRYKLDGQGRTIETRWFGVDDKPALGPDGYAIVRSKYNDTGELAESAVFDAADHPSIAHSSEASIKRLIYNDRQQNIESRWFGVDGSPCKMNNGWAITRRTFDEAGNATQFACFDEHDSPATERGVGEHLAIWTYDPLGNVVEERWFGLDGRLCLQANGRYAIIRHRYDQLGRLIETSYFDTLDRLTINHRDLSAVHKDTYDERGKLSEQRWFGVDCRPCANVNGFAVARMAYDQRGNRIGTSYFDSQDRPALQKAGGYHSLHEIYNDRLQLAEKRWFGIDGKPCLQDDGYSIARMKYNEFGDLIETAYFDAEDHPAAAKSSGVHMTRQVIDARGAVAEQRWFDIDSKPCLNHDGAAGWQMIDGRKIFVGLDGAPVKNAAGADTRPAAAASP